MVGAIVDARRNGSGVVWGLGAHVIKTGLGPVLIDLMERGFVSALATNGAAIIHDFEIALAGATSEDVDEALGPGTVRHGRRDRAAAERRDQRRRSAGPRASARRSPRICAIGSRSTRGRACSRRRRGSTFRSPCTSAIGTDIIHMHPPASGAAIGEGSLRDFRYFVSNVARLERGVYLNCGSAVVLPEVFLKAVALARNRGIALAGLTTVNLDFVRLYRPQTNVVARPTAGTGAATRSSAITRS